MSGKGSAPRPFGVTKEDFDQAWERIFKKSQEKAQETPKKEWERLELPLCPHDVWTVIDGKYVCHACGFVSENGIQYVR